MKLALVLVSVAGIAVAVGYASGKNARALNALAFIGGILATVAGLILGERLASGLNPFDAAAFARALTGGLLFASWVLGIAAGSRLRRGRAPLVTPDAQYSHVRQAQGTLSVLGTVYEVFWWTAISCFVGVAWLVAAEGWVKVFALAFFAIGTWAVVSTVRNRDRS